MGQHQGRLRVGLADGDQRGVGREDFLRTKNQNVSHLSGLDLLAGEDQKMIRHLALTSELPQFAGAPKVMVVGEDDSLQPFVEDPFHQLPGSDMTAGGMLAAVAMNFQKHDCQLHARDLLWQREWVSKGLDFTAQVFQDTEFPLHGARIITLSKGGPGT